MHKVSILFCIGGWQIGGAELHLYKLIKELLNDPVQYDISILLLSSNHGLYTELKIPIYNILSGKHLISIKTFRSIFKFKKEIDEEVTIIHSFLNEANFIASVLKLLIPKTKLIISKRNQDSWKGINKLYALFSNRMADIVTVNAKALVSWYHDLEKIPYKKIKYLPNAVNAGYSKCNSENINRNKIVFINVASLTLKKAHTNLLKAFSLVTNIYDNIELWLVGDGPLKTNLGKLCTELKIDKCVRFFGIRNDIEKFLLKADIFILTSYKEGMSNALLEAASLGLFCIVNDTGGNREVIEKNQHGMLIDDNESITIAKAMERAVKEKLYFRSDKAADIITKEYSLKKMITAHNILYAKLINEKF